VYGGDISGAEAAGDQRVMAPMPGLVGAVEVTQGQSIEKGDTCVIMEAMKVVLRLPAPMSGRVMHVHCEAGETVARGTVLVELEAG
jgi:3-methylcrotonyl-CoA carboxylase alpha subunit